MPKSSGRQPRWLRHRALLSAEAVLVAGLLLDHGSGWVKASGLHGGVKTLSVMAMTLGLLGALVLTLQGAIGKVIGVAYDTIPAVPNALLHVAAFIGLFILYAQVNGFRWWP